MQISSSMYSNVTTSTRINSSSVHTYIFVCFTLRVILQGFVTQNATPLTPPGVMSEANSGMTLHSLVLRCDSFSCNCNSNNSHLSIGSNGNSHISLPLLRVYINQYFSMHLQFQIVQQCIQISTRINSSSVHTYIFSLFHSGQLPAVQSLEYRF